MSWSIEFLEEAKKDMKKLERSASIQVLKGIRKVSKNPLPVQEGVYREAAKRREKYEL